MVRARSGVAGDFGEGRRFDDRAEIGLAMTEPGTTLEEVLSLADRAMYGAEERGRGVLHVVEPEEGLSA
jgi:PleD family two-component response regulator